jgi:hypothetical protein
MTTICGQAAQSWNTAPLSATAAFAAGIGWVWSTATTPIPASSAKAIAESASALLQLAWLENKRDTVIVEFDAQATYKM